MTNRYYKRTDVVNKTYYRIPNFINADFSGIKFKELVFSDGDRLDIIAQKFYGDASHWRAIALFNNISYMFDPKPGDVLRLPIKLSEVLEKI